MKSFTKNFSGVRFLMLVLGLCLSVTIQFANGDTSTQDNNQYVPPHFVAYYPSGCTLNNAAAKITGTCTCIKNTLTGNIWTTTGNNYDTWTNWCNHKSGTLSYDQNCPTTVTNKLDAFNSTLQCGIVGNWHLPTAPFAVMTQGQYLNGETYPGGDWSNLYTTASGGSASPGNAYISEGDLAVWMNNNGFHDILDSTGCSEKKDGTSICHGMYWSSTYNNAGVPLVIEMQSSYLGGNYPSIKSGVLLVNSVGVGK